MDTGRVSNFQGRNRFLSNFWAVPVSHAGRVWKSAEHAYQGAKCADPSDADAIAACATPAEAKRMGRTIRPRPDWLAVRDGVMLEIVRAKFSEGPLRSLLAATGDAELVEGNWWGDVHWGVCEGKGENVLGKLLMQVRDELKGKNP